MRAMPALVDRKNGTITDSCEEFFPCVYCGPLTDYDIDVEREVLYHDDVDDDVPHDHHHMTTTTTTTNVTSG